MPFSFQLLVEFFFPGLIVYCAVVLCLDLIYPGRIEAVARYSESTPSAILIILVFVSGLCCYFLGAIINGVSNRAIRVWMSTYRRSIIRRKLGLGSSASVEDLSDEERETIARQLPRLKSQDQGDRLNELYASARTFGAISSERAGKIIDYHWSLVRLSRATLLPLVLLSVVLLVRSFCHAFSLAQLLAFLGCVLLFFLTLVNYRYREKFLIYTVFDTFFLSARSREEIDRSRHKGKDR
jgi:hypothetical protein